MDMRKKTCCNHAELTRLAVLVAVLSVFEVVLINLGALPPVLSYSPGNLLFAFARLALVAYAGFVLAWKGMKKTALNGAALSMVATLIICGFSLATMMHIGKPVLGLPVTNIESLLLLFVMIIFENAIISAAIAVIFAFIAKKMKRETL